MTDAEFPMKIRVAGIILFAAFGLFVGLAAPFAPDLSQAGHTVLMALLITVGLWIFGTTWIPLSVGSMVMLLIFIVSGFKYSTVFNGYTNRALWILIPALFFGFALNATGLGKRLAYWVIGLFKPSYLTLTLSWVLIGVLLSALTPSIMVRVAIVIPIAVATVDICRLKQGSNGASFLLLAAWSMVLLPGTGWLTGSLGGPVAIGLFDATPALRGIITFNSWMEAMLLPIALLTAIFISALYMFMKPAEELCIGGDVFKQGFKALGPMRFSEKATLAILTLAFLMLLTGQLHHIPDVAICLGAFILLAVFRVITVRDIGPAISWDLILFLGSIMGLGMIFQETGVDTFLNQALSPLIKSMAVHPWLSLFVLLVLLFIWRFLDITQLNATLPFLVPSLPVMAADLGIHPLVFFFIFILAANSFFMSYQQPLIIIGETMAGKASWTSAQLFKAGLLYFFACIVTLALSIPYWHFMGLMK
jgi:anion transporter